MSVNNLEIISNTNLSMSRRKPTINNVITDFYDINTNRIIVVWFNDRLNKNVERKVKIGTKTFKQYVRSGIISAATALEVGFRLYDSGLVINVRRRQYRRNLKVLRQDIQNWLNQNMDYELEIRFADYEGGMNQVLDTIVNVAYGTNVVVRVGDIHYTLNDYNLARLRNEIEAQMFDEEVMNIGITQSDDEFNIALQAFGSLFLVKPKEANQTNLENPNGAYWAWLNKTDIDLSRYGIFSKDITDSHHKEELNINCIVRALQNGGMDETKIQKLRTMIFNRSMPMCRLKDICEKFKICIVIKRMGNNHKRYVYGEEYEKIKSYPIGLIANHYFIIEKIPITSYALKHYWEIKDLDGWNKIVCKRNKKRNDRFITSYDAIKYMYENLDEYFVETKMSSLLDTQFYDSKLDDELFNLDYCEEEDTELNIWDQDKEDWKLKKFKKPIVFFDFETNPNNDPHLPFLVCCEDEAGNKRKFLNTYDSEGNCRYDCGKRFLQSLRGDTLLIAHNAGYDYQFIVKYLCQIDQKTKGSGLMNATAKFYNHRTKKMISIEIKDSYKLITMPLRKFGKCFELSQEKEVMPYNLYNEENIKKRFVPLTEALTHLKEKDHKKFIENVKKWKCDYKKNNINCFDCIKYSCIYCELDVKILREGYQIFRGWILSALGLDINNVWTIASLTDKYLLKQGVYDGVYKLAGIPRLFIQKCVVGGRTMCSQNKMISLTAEKNGRIADLDAVSLYPSAFKRMGELGGVLKGKPKIIKPQHLNMTFLNSVDGYFVKCKILRLGIKRDFPLASIINDKGVRVFRNDIVGHTFHFDKYALEDLMKFQDVDVEIIRGYYYDEGRNPKLKEVIEFMFNERLKKKAEKNPIQLVYKLLMNASYGRSILKPITTTEVVKDNEKDKDLYIQKNYNKVINCVQLYGCNKWRIKCVNPIKDHFNNCVLGVECLSMSKRIMNEVICLAEDNGLKSYYQDTDSIHMDWDDVAKLDELYKEKYNRELQGKMLGQLHIDFDLEDEDGNECKDIYAEKSIFLGKKCYIDCLVGNKCDKDGNYVLDSNGNKIEVRGEHMRMKGVPNSTVKHTSKMLSISNYDLYKQLYDNDEAVEFDLLETDETGKSNRCNFKFARNMSISTLKEFKRKLKFNGEKMVL